MMNEAKFDIKDYINYDCNDKQMRAFQFIGSGKRIFYGGARGGGKSYLILSGFVLASEQFPGLKSTIIRKHHQELEENFIQPMKEKFPDYLFGYKWSERKKTAYFENGSIIIMKPLETDNDVKKAKGLEYQLIGIDEANEFTQEQIEYIEGSLRNPSIKNFKATLLLTGNPGGISDLYFKSRFINPDYKRWRTNELKYKDKNIFIPAKVQDNPYLANDPDYIEKLDNMSENYRQAWLFGNWNVFMGQFFEEWNNDIHVIKSFKVPKEWERQFGFDLGFTEKHPSFGLWGAQDPETLDIHIYREYMRVERVSAIDIYASDIIDMSYGENISMAWADPSIFGKRQISATGEVKYDQESPAYIFLEKGFPLMPANNDRIQGWRILKQWIHWSERRKPKLFIHDNCINLIQIMPTLKYNSNLRGGNTEDLDTNQKLDDAADALRYLIVSGFHYPVVSDYKERNINESYINERPLTNKEKEEIKEENYKRFINTEYDEETTILKIKNKKNEELNIYARF